MVAVEVAVKVAVVVAIVVDVVVAVLVAVVVPVVVTVLVTSGRPCQDLVVVEIQTVDISVVVILMYHESKDVSLTTT